MKIILTLNTVILLLLIGLLWLAFQNSKLLTQYYELEAKSSIELQNHTQAVLSGEKEVTVNHLLAVMQRMSKASESGSKLVQSSTESLNRMFAMIVGLIILQVTISTMYFIHYKKSTKSKEAC